MNKEPRRIQFLRSMPRDERVMFLAGVLGLGVAVFIACGDDDDDQPPKTQDGGADSGNSGGSTAGDCENDPATADNTAKVVTAAKAFLATLTTDQKALARIERTQANAIQWSNFPAGVVKRNGVRIADMAEASVNAALALTDVTAGSTGKTLLADIRAADDAFKSSSGDSSLFGDGQYYFSVHGEPSTASDWMLQIAGHHFVYNFSYNAKCTSATPLFDGAQPAKWTDDSDQAHDPLAQQRDAMAALYKSVASVSGAKLSGTFSDMLNGPAAMGGGMGMGAGGAIDSNYPSSLTYPTTGRGASVASFSTEQKALVKTVIEAWVKNVADPVSSTLLAEYESDDALGRTYVGYSGETDLSTTLSYGRIDGPRVWIEFTVQEGTTGGMAGHYHTIWRDKSADYGLDFASK